MKRLALVALLSLSLMACTDKAEEAKKAAQAKAAAEESVKKAQDEKAAAEAAMKLAKEEQAKAEEAARKAQEEKTAAEKKALTEALAETLKTFADTKAALVEHSGLWKTDGNDTKVQAVLAFAEEYGKLEAELTGVKAYLLQDDLAKASTAFQTAKASFDSLEGRAATMLEDRPQEMDPTVRAIILELIAKETCLQKDRNLGRLTDLEMAAKRNELLSAANYTLTQYELLRAKINFKPQPTDATVIGAHMNSLCPDEATVEAEVKAEEQAAVDAKAAAPEAPAAQR
jgi:hypothetical protein